MARVDGNVHAHYGAVQERLAMGRAQRASVYGTGRSAFGGGTVTNLFTQRLKQALNVARSGETAIVIVPTSQYIVTTLALLGQMLDINGNDWHARLDSHSVHFTGTRGSVRVYTANHATYDAQQRRLRDYPASVATFVHPQVET